MKVWILCVGISRLASLSCSLFLHHARKAKQCSELCFHSALVCRRLRTSSLQTRFKLFKRYVSIVFVLF